MSIKPNLFIIGAMKSGTTSLHNYLNTHPRIAMSNEKEPGYFVKELGLSKGEHWYCDLFDADSTYLYRGESSTHYTKLPIYKNVPKRLFEFCPTAKLIYIMRDPFDRLVSHYWHAVRDLEGRGERRSLLNAVKQRSDYLAFSNYAMQLAPYFALFGRDAVYTLTFESLMRDPNTEVNCIFEWLGLERWQLPTDKTATAHNQKPERMLSIAGHGLLNRIQYSRTWDLLSKIVPQSAKDWAKKLAYRETGGTNTEEELAELWSLISARQLREVEELSVLLGREFPEWSVSQSKRIGGPSLIEQTRAPHADRVRQSVSA